MAETSMHAAGKSVFHFHNIVFDQAICSDGFPLRNVTPGSAIAAQILLPSLLLR